MASSSRKSIVPGSECLERLPVKLWLTKFHRQPKLTDDLDILGHRSLMSDQQVGYVNSYCPFPAGYRQLQAFQHAVDSAIKRPEPLNLRPQNTFAGLNLLESEREYVYEMVLGTSEKWREEIPLFQKHPERDLYKIVGQVTLFDFSLPEAKTLAGFNDNEPIGHLCVEKFVGNEWPCTLGKLCLGQCCSVSFCNLPLLSTFNSVGSRFNQLCCSNCNAVSHIPCLNQRFFHALTIQLTQVNDVPIPEPMDGFFANPAFNFVNCCPSCSTKWSLDQEKLLTGSLVTLFGVLGCVPNIHSSTIFDSFESIREMGQLLTHKAQVPRVGKKVGGFFAEIHTKQLVFRHVEEKDHRRIFGVQTLEKIGHLIDRNRSTENGGPGSYRKLIETCVEFFGDAKYLKIFDILFYDSRGRLEDFVFRSINKEKMVKWKDMQENMVTLRYTDYYLGKKRPFPTNVWDEQPRDPNFDSDVE